MPQLLRFEGSTPEEARSKARKAVGPEATIVRAGRQRSGGVLGFFEHEVYVLEVEACDPLDRLADSVVDAFELSGLADRAPRPASQAAFSQVLAEAEQTVAAAALAAEPRQAGGAVERAGAAAPDRGPATPPRRGDTALSPAEAAGLPGVGAGPPADSDEAAARNARSLRPWRPAARRGARTADAGPEAKPAPERDDGAAAAPLARQVQSAKGAPPAQARPVARAFSPPGAAACLPPPAPPKEVSGRPDRAGTARRDDPLSAVLEELGLPAALLPEPGRPVDVGLLERLRHLPVPPELPGGADPVVLVAGSQQHLGPLALNLAGRLGVGAEGIVAVLSRPRGVPAGAIAVSSARDAAAEVAERRIARRPSVVAVECRPSGRLPRLLEHVAAAVRADAAWAVLPARCEPAQLQAIAAAMRRLDAVCLVELDRAERPAGVLAAGVPVAALDGRVATPILWAARLLDRCVDEWRQQ